MRLLTLSEIKLPVGESEKKLLAIAERKLGKKAAYFRICKKSLDARDKNNLRYVYTVEVGDQKPQEKKAEFPRLPKTSQPENKVLIVGAGPAGLFCALRLLDHGITPIVIERGAPVEQREKDITRFIQTKGLNTESNVQFGEGGAGTFSDGKLNTQTHSPLNREVLERFVAHGAPQEILYVNKPHIGSDNLKIVVKNMRGYIRSKGGEIRFYTRLDDVYIKAGKLCEVTLNSYTVGGNGEHTDKKSERIAVSAVVLAVGHSARDTFEMLLSRGVKMQSKDFAVGVRIEHLQNKIGFAQYGAKYPLLPAADYKLVAKCEDRSAFTFCMCPGGYVMPATSEEGCVVTNGMSNYARDNVNANSALIAQVTKADFGEGVLAGMEFQRKLERAAYVAGGNTYAAPVQRVEDFLKGKESCRFGEVLPTYAAGTAFSDMHAVLPQKVCSALKSAIVQMEKRLHGFADVDALLTGVETRTSSPVRIEREENLQAVGIDGLYPCGEGAGYAGGITSSAADGLRVAEAIFHMFNDK